MQVKNTLLYTWHSNRNFINTGVRQLCQKVRFCILILHILLVNVKHISGLEGGIVFTLQPKWLMTMVLSSPRQAE